MTENSGLLSESNLAKLHAAFHQGSLTASKALEQWLGKSSLISIDSFEQLPLEEATEILSDSDTPVLFGAVQITGALSGEMILAFDEDSGLSLVEMLVGPVTTNEPWNELNVSAVLETTNIVCCAYLNSLAASLESESHPVSLLPSTAAFKKEYPQSLLQFALMGQAMVQDHVLIAKTLFEVDGSQTKWTLLFLPDAESMNTLPKLLNARTEVA